ESTSPIGTTRNVVGRILGESGLLPGRDFDLCYCPERVLPGNTAHELIHNHRLIGGVTPQSAEHAQQIYERFAQGRLVLTDDRTPPAARPRGREGPVHHPRARAGTHLGLVVSNDLPASRRGAAGAVLLCEHKPYRVLSAKYFGEHLAGKLIADARHWLNHASL